MTGHGQIDMVSPAFKMTAYMSARGVSLTMDEVIDHGILDIAINANGQTLADLTGKHWVQIPIDSTSGVDQLQTGDPVAALQVLRSQGADVRPVGTRIINGVATTGYRVVPTKAAIVAEAKKTLATAGLTPDQVASLDQEIEHLAAPKFIVWIDKAQLARRVTMVMDFGGSVGLSGTINMDFTRYGAPVSIAPPPADDVGSFSDFLNAVGNS
jgi:hypothetical protein